MLSCKEARNSSREEVDCQSASKGKKKKLSKTNTDKVGSSTDRLRRTKCKRSNSELDVTTENARSSACDATSEKRNVDEIRRSFSSPVIVDVLANKISMLTFPKSFEYDSDEKAKTDVSSDLGSERDTVKDACYAKKKRKKYVSLTDAKENAVEANVGNKLDSFRWNSDVSTSNSTNDEIVDVSNIKKKYNSGRLKKIAKNHNSISCSATRKTVRLYSLHKKVVVIMQENSNFSFTGKLLVEVLYGAVETYGAVLTSSNTPAEVYSPKGDSLVTVQTSDKYTKIDEIKNIWTSLSQVGITPTVDSPLKYDLNNCKPGTVVILISYLENTLTRFLDNHCPIKLFPKIRNVKYHSWTDARRAEAILQTNLYFDDKNCKRLNVDSAVITELSKKMLDRSRSRGWSCTLIAGGKSVGKSTTMRYLVNNLLSTCKMVVLVDLDPGQTECTSPGCISYSLIEKPLMGPNFTHLNMPVYQLYIGDVNVSRCIMRYIESVKMLIEKLSCCPMVSRFPIIVNTMGFTEDLGWDIIVFIIKLIQPTNILQIISNKRKNNFRDILSTEVINRQPVSRIIWDESIINWDKLCTYELHLMDSYAEQCQMLENQEEESMDKKLEEMFNMKPYQRREIMVLSYLSGILNQNENLRLYREVSSSNINAVIPYVIPFASLIIALPQASVPPSHALTVINGNIVALCGVDLTADLLQQSARFNPQVLTTMPLCTCYGFGIVRGIDFEKEEVLINTPLPFSILQYVNCLMDCIPVPVSLLKTIGRSTPYIAGRNNVLPTSREHRRGYFRMRYDNNRVSN